MTPTTSSAVLPMWRSPTSSSYNVNTYYHQDSWEDDEAYSTINRSPTRALQCLNFLSQVERVSIHSTRKGLCDTVFILDVYLTEIDSGAPAAQPTYQILRSLTELEELHGQMMYWSTQHLHHGHKNFSPCKFCGSLQNKCAAWQQRWPRRFLSRLLLSQDKCESLVQSMLSSLLELSRAQAHFDDAIGSSCVATQEVPAALTSFLVRQELSMEE